MEKNKFKLFIPIILMVILLSATIYKIIKNREEKLYDVLYGKIEYAAKECFLKKDCIEKITLQDLYDKKYLDYQYDPVTKELLDPNIIIEYKEEKINIKF